MLEFPEGCIYKSLGFETQGELEAWQDSLWHPSNPAVAEKLVSKNENKKLLTRAERFRLYPIKNNLVRSGWMDLPFRDDPKHQIEPLPDFPDPSFFAF
jgi:hypothetical protein